MIAKSWLSRCWQWQIGGCVAIFGALSVGVSDRVLAQIVPDNTLGAERSVVTPNLNIRGIPSDRIDGGAPRGANLFHSFSDFNAGQGRGVYFANPAGIENILTRVTGNKPSNIFGRLGVLGGANLFLLNPHGIVFGQNATLDIQGSFLATTADRIQLGDSGYFSAAEPQKSSLLSVSPGALFFDAVANQPSSIINQGNLSTGKHLTLAANNLDLQGQLQALGDLTLQAQDTVKVRDTVAAPFLARSGGNLTIIGNGGIDILALNHPTQTPFVSGGNLSLISDGVISGDAHFSSGGSFSIKSVSGGLANFVSLYDPVISSDGDVDVAANYTGASLLVESKGNIRVLGDINITAPDTSGLPTGRDTATLSTSTALIMRSGQSALAYGGVNSGSVLQDGTGAVPAGITLGGNVTLQPFNGAGGIVKLLAASGNVSTQGMATNGGAININSAGSITTNGQTLSTKNGDDYDAYLNSYDPNSYTHTYTGSGLPALQGGAISLLAANANITTGDLDSYSFSVLRGASGGGNIRLEASNGSINTGNLKSLSFSGSGNAGQGGAITLTAANGINITDYLFSFSYSESGNAGQGGAITLTAANGSITTDYLASSSHSGSGNAGQGGAITLTAANDINITGFFVSDSSSHSGSGNAGQGGAITLTAANDINITSFLVSGSFSYSGSGNAGQGGAITLTAANGNITTDYLDSDSFSRNGNAGQGGAITLTAANGNITTGFFVSSSESDGSGNAGQGGAITLTAANGSITTGYLDSSSFSYSGNAGQGGAITLTAANDNITTGYLFSDSSSDSGNAGQGGAITLTATNGSITTRDLYSFSSSGSGSAGQGGAITLMAAHDINITDYFASASFSESGNASQGGAITLSAANDININGYLNSASYSESGNAGQGGEITLSAANDINITGDLYSFSYSVSGKAGQGGAISLSAKSGEILGIPSNSDDDTKARSPVLGSFSLSEQATAGNGGNVVIEAKNNVSNLDILTLSSSSQSGTVQVTGLGDLSLTDTNIVTSKKVTVPDPFVFGRSITLDVSGKGQSGDVAITSLGNLTFNNSSIESDTKGIDNAGNVTISSPGRVTFDNSSIRSNTSNTGAAGRINIEAGQGITLIGSKSELSTIFAGTTNSGEAGDITLTTPTTNPAKSSQNLYKYSKF
jgi:filamentous hemagglutinin family protein